MLRLVFALLIAGASSACASSTQTLDERAQAIEGQVWSPYCPGRLLIDCTTTQARELRRDIAGRLDRGETSEQVLDWIRRNHGDEALARPAGTGSGLLIWLVPALLFFVGSIVVVALVRRWTRATAPEREL